MERWYTMIDRLIDKIVEKKNPTVVGLDPTLKMIPAYIKNKAFATFERHRLLFRKCFTNSMPVSLMP